MPAPQERGFGRAIPAEMVVTTGGLKVSKKAPDASRAPTSAAA